MANIIYAVNHILEALLLYFYIFSLYPHRIKRSKEILLFLGSYSVLFYAFLHQSIYLNLTLQLFIYALIAFLLTGAGWLDAVKCSLLTVLLITIAELSFDIPTVLFSSDTEFEYPTLSYLITAALIIRSVHFVLMLLLIKVQKRWQNIPRSTLYDLFTVLFLFAAVIALFAIQALGFISVLSDHLIPWVFSILIAVLSLCIGSVIFSMLFQKSQYDLISSRNELQRQDDESKYNDLVSELDQNQRIMIHDFRKHIQTALDLSRTKSYDELEDYLSSLESDPVISEKSLNLSNKTLNVMLLRYKAICEEKQVAFTMDVAPDGFSDLSPTETTALFGNLLDNAVESVLSCEDPHIHLIIKYTSPQNASVMTLVNNCSSPPVQNKEGQFLSSKREKLMPGIGMKSIQRVIDNRGGIIHCYFNKEDYTFHTTLTIQSRKAHK